MQAHDVFIGVDVAKASLSICRHGEPGGHELSNDEASIRRWLCTLPRQAVIAVESTGRYHQLLVRLAYAMGHRTFVLNARDVYFYAKALGVRGKTDRTDARLIARYLAEHHDALKPWAPGTAAQDRLHELLRCRAGVTCKRMSLRQVLRDVPDLSAAVEGLERQFDELLDHIDRQVATLVAADVRLSQGCAALRTITGFGPQGSAMLAALLSRVDFANADALVAYSGLDPRPNDSGAKTGRRHISKRGSPDLRRQLYLAAFAASHSKALGPLYRSIKAKGFKPTQALVILARKLLRIAWAVWKSAKPFDPSLVTSPEACAKT
ncbi:IS110 family transposase [Ideonella sp. A 288]|uniref:IS110 family transposase n=1 Tax=Ideonella sp. A 288 TaxID=1962181 RepID=UPI000B4BDF4D|nr:IS110 family transposase [Ideonella sp. A 288]